MAAAARRQERGAAVEMHVSVPPLLRHPLRHPTSAAALLLCCSSCCSKSFCLFQPPPPELPLCAASAAAASSPERARLCEARARTGPRALLVDVGALDGSPGGLDAKADGLVVAGLTDTGLL